MASSSENSGGSPADDEEWAGEFRPGEEIPGSGCRVERVLGRGGHATAYEVTNDIGKALVVKVIHRHLARREGMAERLLKEAKSLALLDHPNIVEVYRAGITTGPSPQAYIEMQLLHGKDGRHLVGNGPLDLGPCVDILSEVSSALAAAHGAGIIHQDLKLDNLFAHHDKRTKRLTMKLLDFGVARVIGESAPKGLFEGTIEYAAPEQLSFNFPVTFKVDLYALGVIAFELLAGRRPYQDTEDYDRQQDEMAAARGEARDNPFDLELIRVKLAQEAPRLSEFIAVPRRLDDLVASLLSIDPNGRPSTATEVEAALAEIAQGASMKRRSSSTEAVLLSKLSSQVPGGEIAGPRARAVPRRNTALPVGATSAPAAVSTGPRDPGTARVASTPSTHPKGSARIDSSPGPGSGSGAPSGAIRTQYVEADNRRPPSHPNDTVAMPAEAFAPADAPQPAVGGHSAHSTRGMDPAGFDHRPPPLNATVPLGARMDSEPPRGATTRAVAYEESRSPPAANSAAPQGWLPNAPAGALDGGARSGGPSAGVPRTNTAFALHPNVGEAAHGSDENVGAQGRSSKLPLAVGALGGALLVIAVAGGIMLTSRAPGPSTGSPVPPRLEQPVVAPPATPQPEAPRARVADLPTEPAAPTAVPTATPTSQPPTHAEPAVVAPRTPPRPIVTTPRTSPAEAVTARPPAAAKPPNCDPPYTISASGDRVPKHECM